MSPDPRHQQDIADEFANATDRIVLALARLPRGFGQIETVLVSLAVAIRPVVTLFQSLSNIPNLRNIADRERTELERARTTAQTAAANLYGSRQATQTFTTGVDAARDQLFRSQTGLSAAILERTAAERAVTAAERNLAAGTGTQAQLTRAIGQRTYRRGVVTQIRNQRNRDRAALQSLNVRLRGARRNEGVARTVLTNATGNVTTTRRASERSASELAGAQAGRIAAAGGLVVAALAAVSAAAGALQDVFRRIVGWVEKFNPGTVEMFNYALDNLSATIGMYLSPVIQLMTRVVDQVSKSLSGLMEVVGPMIYDIFANIGDFIVSHLNLIRGLIVSVVWALGLMVTAIELAVDALDVLTLGFFSALGNIGSKTGATATAAQSGRITTVEDIGRQAALAATRASNFGTITEDMYRREMLQGTKNMQDALNSIDRQLRDSNKAPSTYRSVGIAIPSPINGPGGLPGGAAGPAGVAPAMPPAPGAPPRVFGDIPKAAL